MENEANDTILSEFKDPRGQIECHICGIYLQNPEAYENHLGGRRHRKKVAQEGLRATISMAHVTSDHNLIHKTSDPDKDDSDDSREIYCEICDIKLSGPVSYILHINGKVHEKISKKQKLKEKLADMPEVLKIEDGENDSLDDDFLQKAYAKCALCSKEFSGPESFSSHLESNAHKKKKKQAEILQKQNPAEAIKYDDGEFNGRCEDCHKRFSGIEPYQIHMNSKIHKKTLEKKKVAEEMKEFYVRNGPNPSYCCKECEAIFKDPVALKCHIENNSHEKRKAKDALEKFMASYPEIIFTTPFENEKAGDETDDNDEADTKYYLICKLCHVCFTGPESAQDHVNSKRHITIKKEKKVMKLLNEQKKNQAELFDDKNAKISIFKLNSKKDPSMEKANNSSANGLENNVEEFEIL